jgi:hypothetical protein
MATTSDNYVNYLAQSAAWAIPELFGIDAPSAVQEWRADNPVGGFASSFAGSTVPYIGWYKWGSRALKMEKILAGLAESKKLGTVGGMAAAEAVRFMPLEAGRIFGNQAFGSHGLGEMVSSAAINTALAGAAGGLGGIVKTMGTRKKLPEEIIPGVNSVDPPQLQLRGIQTDFATIPPADQPAAYGRMDNLRVAVRSEDAPYEHIGVMSGRDGNMLPERKRAELNRIFDTRRLNKGDVRARKFLADPKHFKDDVSWMNKLGEFGVAPGGKFEDAVQFPRFVQGVNPAGQLRARTLFDDYLQRIDTDTYMGREADDGLFVIAKRSQKEPDDWLLFKTDQPDLFNQGSAQFGSVVVNENAWARQDPNLYRSGGAIDDAFNDLRQRMPLQNYRFGLKTSADGMSLSKAGSWTFDKASDLMGFSGVRKTLADSEAVASVKRFFNQHFTPGMYQFKGRVRANYIDGMMRAGVDMGKAHANKLLYGEAKLDPGKGLIWQTQTYANKKAGGVMDKILYDLKDEEVKQIWDAWRNEVSQKNLPLLKTQGKLTDKAFEVANEMHTIARQLDLDSVAQKHKYGGGAFRPRDDHMMIAKQWNGDQLLEIRDKRNALVGLASGDSAKQVENEAARIIKEGPPGDGWRTGASFRYSSGANLPPDVKAVRDQGIPGHFLGGTRVRGHRWSTDDQPWTRKEMAEEFASAVHARAQQQVSMTLDNTMASDMDKLSMDDIDAFGNIATRMADLRGEQRPMAKWLNQQADTILAPLLGRNSANKIVEVTNKAMWHLELGGLRIGYTLLNAITPIQTVLPHVAMLLNADQAMLGDYYTHFAAMGTKGPVGTVGFLSPWKVMKETLKAMRSPDQQEFELYNWAMNNGVISPRIVEEFIGGNATAIQRLGASLKSPGSFGEKFIPFLGQLSEFLPSSSEKFSRGFSFMAGIKTGRLMGITDTGDLAQFAKRFTERTNYLYGQADRAGIMTGPVGGTLGLFKNWMMHYIGNMAEYAGEGMYRNNWTPLLWQTATTFGIGGFAATPLYPIAQTFNDWASDKPLMENMYEAMGTEAADDFLYGLPATVGYSLTSQASSPFSNPTRDATMFFSIVHADRMKYFAQAAGAAWDNWQLTGQHPGESEEVTRALSRAVLPKAIYKTIDAMMNDTVESWSTGYPVTGKKESLLDRSMMAIGFTPVDIERTYAATDILYKDAQYRRAMVAAAGKAYLEAQKAGDSRAMFEVIQGAKNAGLSLSSVFKSAATRNRSGRQDMIDRTFSPMAKQRVKAMLLGD